MIVRTLDDGKLILVNQTEHAKLSGLFAAHWGNADFALPAPRESAMRAANVHDNGWLRYEISPLYDPVAKVSPTYFQVPTTEAQLAAFGQAIDWLTDIDPYAGLLISRHRTGLYRSRYGAVSQPASATRTRNDDRLDAFIARYEASQATAMAAIDRAQFLVTYQLLQFWDVMSLALCMREPRDEVFEFVPDRYGGDGKSGVRIAMHPVGGGDIRLDPFPFDTAPLAFSYCYKRISPHDIADEATFRVAYFGAAPQINSFRFVRG